MEPGGEWGPVYCSFLCSRPGSGGLRCRASSTWRRSPSTSPRFISPCALCQKIVTSSKSSRDNGQACNRSPDRKCPSSHITDLGFLDTDINVPGENIALINYDITANFVLTFQTILTAGSDDHIAGIISTLNSIILPDQQTPDQGRTGMEILFRIKQQCSH